MASATRGSRRPASEGTVRQGALSSERGCFGRSVEARRKGRKCGRKKKRKCGRKEKRKCGRREKRKCGRK